MMIRNMRLRIRRKWYCHLIMIFFVFNLGCIHSRYIHRDRPTEELETVNKELAGKKAQIALFRDAKRLPATEVYLSADSVHYVDAKTGVREQVAISDVHRITTRDHGRGATEGLTGGLIAWGGLVGLSILAIGGKADPAEDGPGEGILVYFAILGGASLPIVGTIIGATTGHKEIYVL